VRGVARLGARGQPIVRSSAALIANTGINAVLGFAYWVAAARLFPEDVVGHGSAAISAVLLVSSFGWIGLQHSLMRYLPVAGGQSARLVGLVYLTALGVAVPVSVLFLALGGAGTIGGEASTDAGLWLAFIGAVVVWVLFSLQDAALTGLRLAAWVPVENAIFGLAKIVVLMGFAATASSWVIVASWVVPAAFLALVVSALLVRVVLPARREASTLPSPGGIARFAIGHQAVALVAAAPDSLVPLLVVAMLGPAANAFYYVAWTLSFSLRLVAVNVGSALTVEGSASGTPMGEMLRTIRVPLAGMAVAVLVGTWLAAELILSVFGPSYAAESAGLLRVFVLGLIPFTVVTLFVAGERIHQRSGTALAIVTVSTVTTLALDVILLPAMGILGAGVAWVVAQTAALLLAGAVALRRRTGSRPLETPSRPAAEDGARAERETMSQAPGP
jgi:O-antigen/teichoic acid export membrane protein